MTLDESLLSYVDNVLHIINLLSLNAYGAMCVFRWNLVFLVDSGDNLL
jgi:hypothetical protein